MGVFESGFGPWATRLVSTAYSALFVVGRHFSTSAARVCMPQGMALRVMAPLSASPAGGPSIQTVQTVLESLGFCCFWFVSLGSRPTFRPSRPYFRVSFCVAVFL